LGDPDKDVAFSRSLRFVAESLTVRHPYSIGEGRDGFARQEACQTLVWNEARRICWLTYVLAKDQNHVKTSIHIPLQKTFNVLTT
jgi:hypothetical protein